MKYFVELSKDFDFLTAGCMYPVDSNGHIIDDENDNIRVDHGRVDETGLILELS